MNEKPEKTKGKSLFAYLAKNPLIAIGAALAIVLLAMVMIAYQIKLSENTVPFTTMDLRDTVENRHTSPSLLERYDQELKHEEELGTPYEEEKEPTVDDIVKVDYSIKNKFFKKTSPEKDTTAPKVANRNVVAEQKPKIIYVEKKGSKPVQAKETQAAPPAPAADGFASIYNPDASFRESEAVDREEAVKGVEETKFVKAVIHGDYKVDGVTPIKIRLKDQAVINGIVYPKNTIGYGTAQLAGSRVNVTITSMENYPTDLAVYDAKDRADGIFYQVPQEINNTAEDTKNSAVQRSTAIGTGSQNTVVSQGVGIVRDIAQSASTNKNIKKRNNVAFLADQYKILIKIN